MPASRPRGATAPCRLCGQQGHVAEQVLCVLRAGHELAASMGEELGQRQVLFRSLPAQQGCSWLNCAT